MESDGKITGSERLIICGKMKGGLREQQGNLLGLTLLMRMKMRKVPQVDDQLSNDTEKTENRKFSPF